MSVPAKSPSPKPSLKGTLTVKVVKCTDLEKKRLLSSMDPYVKLDLGFDEKFKTKVAENQNQNPVFEQAFLFNLDGKQTDLHIRVFDSELVSDTYIGRADLALMAILATGGGEKNYPLYDPDNFRKITGNIVLQVTFSGTGGPSSAAEVAPISGNFHFQHNSTGLLAHAVGEKLLLAPGGLNDVTHSFEWQGPYIRYVPTSQYLTGFGADNSVFLKAGISEDAKWKWTGIGLQHEHSGKILHPLNDTLAAQTPLVLASGSTAASGFSLVSCTGVAAPAPAPAVSPIASAPPATNPHAALPNVAGLAISQQQHHQPETHAPAYPAIAGGWHCQHCTFENVASRNVCEMCSKSRGPVSPPVAHPVVAAGWDLDIKSTWPEQVHVKTHPHALKRLGEIYQGTASCKDRVLCIIAMVVSTIVTLHAPRSIRCTKAACSRFDLHRLLDSVPLPSSIALLL